jgi:site-specific recombinase XerD
MSQRESSASTEGQRVEQPSLFFPEAPAAPISQAGQSALVTIASPTGDTPLGACALPYQEHLRRTDHSAYTITCFLSDLRMFTEFVGRELAVRDLTLDHLRDWLDHLRFDRETRPAPKTMARRITFLRNLCAWLAAEQALPTDLSAQIALSRPMPPLPELLYDDDVARLEVAAAEEPRAQTLILLILATGLKKEEVMGLALRHIDVSDPDHPAIEVHFPGQAKRRRERRMELPAAWTAAYQTYCARYQPRERLFECTDRNLNYVLASIVKRAGIEKRVTLQLLRDIYAVRQLRAGVSMEELREKLGLSEEAWYETADKYRKLAFPA